jgi:hypothetical protein
MADWVKISSLPEFSGGAAEGGPLFGDNGAEANPFAQGAAHYPAGSAAFPAENTRADQSAFSAPAHAPSASALPDLFASPPSGSAEAAATPAFAGFEASPSADPFAAPARSVGNGSGMASSAGLTGQRHENSVLFSLSNLEALAKPSPAPMPVAASPRSSPSAPTTEGSGLIDIRAMASMTLGASSGPTSRSDANDLPAFSAPQFSPVAPVLLPVSHGGGMPGWAKVTLGALGLVFVALAIVIIKLLASPASAPVAPTAPVVAQPSAPAQPTAAAPPVTASPPKPAAPEPPLPPREAPVAAATPDKGDKGDKGDHHGKAPAARPAAPGGKRPGAATRPEPPTERPSVAAAARPEPPPPGKAAPAAPEDEITRLIKGATGSKTPAAAARPEPEAAPAKAAASLGQEDIVRGMNGVMPKTRDCYNQYKVPGLAMVNITVDPSGRVSAANVGGKFAGTPTGGCIENAVKTAKFPRSSGLNFKWPVNLH